MSLLRKELEDAVVFRAVPCSPERVQSISPALRMLLRREQGGLARGPGAVVVFRTNDVVLRYLQTEALFLSLFDDGGGEGALLPLVPLYCTDLCGAELYKRLCDVCESRPGASLVGLQGLGVFAWGGSRSVADLRMDFFLGLVKIRQYAELNPGFDEAAARASCRAAYEKAQAGQGLGSGLLAEKIAVITGAAQGLGAGIAAGLAGAGAYVVLADLNGAAAAEKARLLNAEYGAGKALAVKTDVTCEADVRRLVEEAVAAYGGLDIFISNAGILKAGSLEEMRLADFTLSTQVNYTAFFLCAKYASAPMKLQAQFAPGYFTDIIQVNSKSGLAGSRKNSAYAGSKFGGIGLMESFALELVEYNIKVNAVCPGNFFEGPLWSHPETGLFVQYLKAGKVPGAVTAGDVRRYYENQVPMKRGCRVVDVVKAVLYIIDQEYETGQAVPVTGGQIMLR